MMGYDGKRIETSANMRVCWGIAELFGNLCADQGATSEDSEGCFAVASFVFRACMSQ